MSERGYWQLFLGSGLVAGREAKAFEKRMPGAAGQPPASEATISAPLDAQPL